jgi:hypothetical protein
MKVRVRFGPAIRSYVGNNPVLEMEATSVNEVIDQLDKLYPGFRESLTDSGGNLSRHIEIMVALTPSDPNYRKLALNDKIPEGHTSLRITMRAMPGG